MNWTQSNLHGANRGGWRNAGALGFHWSEAKIGGKKMTKPVQAKAQQMLLGRKTAHRAERGAAVSWF